ncbi:hypothetical protein D3C83_252700 [compost metagenome]
MEGAGQRGNLARLGDAAGAGHIRLRDADRARGDKWRDAGGGEVALAGGEPYPRLLRENFVALEILRHDRLL